MIAATALSVYRMFGYGAASVEEPAREPAPESYYGGADDEIELSDSEQGDHDDDDDEGDVPNIGLWRGGGREEPEHLARLRGMAGSAQTGGAAEEQGGEGASAQEEGHAEAEGGVASATGGASTASAWSDVTEAAASSDAVPPATLEVYEAPGVNGGPPPFQFVESIVTDEATGERLSHAKVVGGSTRLETLTYRVRGKLTDLTRTTITAKSFGGWIGYKDVTKEVTAGHAPPPKA